MSLTKYRTFFLAVALLMPGIPASAASFILPEDAVVVIEKFPFPAEFAKNTDRDLPVAFRSQLILALQQVGFTVPNLEKNTVLPLPEQPELRTPLVVTPLTETTYPEEHEPKDVNGPIRNEANGQPVPDDSELSQNGQIDPVSVPAPRSPTHILTGSVTMFQKSASAPTRIAEHIHIRSETSMHCTYQVKDAVTGKVIISNVASSSAARLTSRTQDIDTILPVLTDRVLSAVAAKVAAHLSGTEEDNGRTISDQAYYQDSPGKRLKP